MIDIYFYRDGLIGGTHYVVENFVSLLQNRFIVEEKKAVQYGAVDLMIYSDLVYIGTCEMKNRQDFIYVYMDNKGNGTLKIAKKKSFEWYKKVIELNAECLDQIKFYKF